MPSVGAHLRQLREARGVSLEEIARATRVTHAYLHALEGDDFASLPVPVFTRGFIRAYCQALGQPVDEALALFDSRGDAPAPSSAAGTPSRATSEPTPRNRGPVLVSFVLLVVLGIALFAVTLALQSGRETAEDPRAGRVPPAPRAAGSPTPAPATGAPPAPMPGAAAPARPTGYRLVARTIEPTWIRVRTDDGRAMEETIPAGQVREWVSTGPFTLTVGNAGGINLELNGRALPPLGASGVVIPRLVVPTEIQ